MFLLGIQNWIKLETRSISAGHLKGGYCFNLPANCNIHFQHSKLYSYFERKCYFPEYVIFMFQHYDREYVIFNHYNTNCYFILYTKLLL